MYDEDNAKACWIQSDDALRIALDEQNRTYIYIGVMG